MLRQRQVEHLEHQLAEAIEQLFQHLGPRDKPAEITSDTAHLMAKAAISVYEAVVAAGKR